MAQEHQEQLQEELALQTRLFDPDGLSSQNSLEVLSSDESLDPNPEIPSSDEFLDSNPESQSQHNEQSRESLALAFSDRIRRGFQALTNCTSS